MTLMCLISLSRVTQFTVPLVDEAVLSLLHWSERIFNYRLSLALQVVENMFAVFSPTIFTVSWPLCNRNSRLSCIVRATLFLHNLMRTYYPGLQNNDIEREGADHSVTHGAWRNADVLIMIDKVGGNLRTWEGSSRGCTSLSITTWSECFFFSLIAYWLTENCILIDWELSQCNIHGTLGVSFSSSGKYLNLRELFAEMSGNECKPCFSLQAIFLCLHQRQCNCSSQHVLAYTSRWNFLKIPKVPESSQGGLFIFILGNLCNQQKICKYFPTI